MIHFFCSSRGLLLYNEKTSHFHMKKMIIFLFDMKLVEYFHFWKTCDCSKQHSILILQKTLIVEENKMHTVVFISVMLVGVLAVFIPIQVSHFSSKNMEISSAINLMNKRIILTNKRLERDIDNSRIIYTTNILQCYTFKKHKVSYHQLFFIYFPEGIS